MPTTTVPCSNTAKTRNPLKFAGVPQTTAPISAASGPKFTILCRHVEEILLLNKFFLIVDMCLSCKRYSPTSCAMVPRWRFLATFVTCILQRAARNMFQTCILNSRYGHTICGSMVDIQSPTAEIRRGKKIEEQHENIMACPITSGPGSTIGIEYGKAFTFLNNKGWISLKNGNNDNQSGLMSVILPFR